ncbi:MAG: Hsp20/alpha crystallin family protein [Chloroflexi bacterium]|nr:Hsp20/alpha crystallin family protein [Chloroflexota bacterium]
MTTGVRMLKKAVSSATCWRLTRTKTEKSYIITTELPGVKSENINIRQEGDYLLIDAEIPETTTEREGQRALIKERRYGRFTRRLRLPQNIDFSKAEANYEDGVLTLTLPKAEQAQPKVIQEGV